MDAFWLMIWAFRLGLPFVRRYDSWNELHLCGSELIVSRNLSEPIRSHKDLDKDYAPYYHKAVKFYGLSKQLIHQGHLLDVFACALDQLKGGTNDYDFKSVKRWTTQRKLGYCLIECDKIFVPIHKETHWCLPVINKKDEKFQYLDSLKGMDKQVMKILTRARVHQFTAAVWSCKPLEVYKGKGIMYIDEVIKKKQEKKSK